MSISKDDLKNEEILSQCLGNAFTNYATEKGTTSPLERLKLAKQILLPKDSKRLMDANLKFLVGTGTGTNQPTEEDKLAKFNSTVDNIAKLCNEINKKLETDCKTSK